MHAIALQTMRGLAVGMMLALVSPATAQDFPISTSNTNVGYIDSATIGNRLRFRFDAGYDLFPPDRAEFFYSSNPRASAPSHVDYQELSTYLELARSDWFSAFIESPLRSLNPDLASNTKGFADINMGLKAALVADETSCTTFQFRAYLPTGDDSRRLGTGNVNVEPALLNYLRLTDRLVMESEFRSWIPVTSADFPGTVLRYGIGLSCNNSQCRCTPSLSPVVEIVGWSVLDGLKTTGPGVMDDAVGDTIVNAKLGVRLNYKSDQLYAGFGQALTSETWYQQILRVEYRMAF